MDALAAVRQNPMSRFQIVTVTTALVLIMLDGFEVGIMAFAAPQIQADFGLTADILGYVLSASLFGMATGSMVLTPLADTLGRRPVTIAMLAIIVIGMAMTVFSGSATELVVWRIVTGLGIGGMMANLNALVAEYSSDKRRSSVIGIYAAGYPIGATIAGLVARPLIPEFGWHSAFVAGTILSVIALVASWFLMPESVDFLVTKRPRNALERTNALLAKMHVEPMERLPEPATPATDDSADRKSTLREVLTPPTLRLTIALWVGYAFVTAAYYFANTWIPTIVTNVSGDEGLGSTMGILANFGGILGCFIFAGLAVWMKAQKLLVTTLVAAAAAFAAFGVIFEVISIALVVGLLLGVLTTAGIAGFYAVSPGVYSATARATGIGWMIGIGRFFSVLAPILVGYLLAAGVAPERIFIVFAAPLLIAGIAAATLAVGRRATTTSEGADGAQETTTATTSTVDA